jgi:predicted ATP-dependent protease
MTGELTLRGLVLPVGGIKEKLLAARAAGLSRALVPARNMRDVQLEAAEATAPEDEDNDGDVILDCNNVTDTQFPKQQQQCGNRRQSRQGLEVVPVAKFEDVLAAAFDPPYVLKKQSRL